MKSLKIKKLIAVAVTALTIATMSQVGASAAWRQDSNGWWNTKENSWSVGWETVDNNWYYFGSSGYMKTGWLNDGGTWYFTAPSGEMKTGWINDGGKWYFTAASGAMETGWVNDGGTWYFTTASGAMETGVVEIDGKVYYLAASGAMATGDVTIDGVTYTFAASGEAIGDKIPTPTLAFSSTGTATAVTPTKTTGTTTGSTGTTSSGGGGGSSNNSGSSETDITSLISDAYSDRLASLVNDNSVLANNIKVTAGNPILVTLLDSSLDSLKTVFETAQAQDDLSVIEARINKAVEIMNLNSTMLKINGDTFTSYLAQAEDNYVASGGNDTYFNEYGSFDTHTIAEKIYNNTLTYNAFKTALEDRVIAMCDETKEAPEVTISEGTISRTVTKIQKDGTDIYNTSSTIATNITGLVSLGDTTTGTYKIYCGTYYFTVKVTK